MVPLPGPYDPWTIDEREFPLAGRTYEQLYFALRYAMLAPSSHNSQPWLFKIHDEGVSLYADRTRALPVVDPEDRELIISCGAALLHLCLAVRHFGFTASVEAFPDPADPDLLACVRLGAAYAAPPEEQQLFQAIPQRHTNRHPFQDRPVPPALQLALHTEVRVAGAVLSVLHAEERDEVVKLIADGDQLQWQDKGFRRELAAWVHANRSRSYDGMPGYAHGVGTLASLVGPLVIRTFDRGDGTAAHDVDLATGSPLLAVLGTDEDTPDAWLRAGQALARVALRAQAEGVAVSYLNQPIEVPALRSHLGALVQWLKYPQLLLRMGYGDPARPTPRRSVDDVLLLM